MIGPIVDLPRNQYQGYEVPVTYETTGYFGLRQEKRLAGFSFSLQKRDLPAAIIKSFTINLYPDYLPGAEAFGIKGGENLLGLIEIDHETWNNRLRITELWVDPNHRRQGIGKLLMDFAFMKANEYHARAVILETQATNVDAIQFYLARGFGFFGVDLYSYSNQDIVSKEVRLELGVVLEDA